MSELQLIRKENNTICLCIPSDKKTILFKLLRKGLNTYASDEKKQQERDLWSDFLNENE